MSVQIALLRAINVGGRAMVAMSDLRALAEDLGFTGVRTLLQSGNLVLRSDMPSARGERALEQEAKKRLGLETDIMVRTAAQWRAILARNPFPEHAKRAPASLLRIVCKEAP